MGGVGQVGFGPLQRIDGPPPLPPRYGLLQAAMAPAAGVRFVTETDDRWLNGVEAWPFPAGPASIWVECATGSLGATKDTAAGLDNPRFGPFTVYLPVDCTALRVHDPQTIKARALVSFAAYEGAAVEREFLEANQTVENPHLADGMSSFPNGDDATNIPNAVGLLEQYIAQSGQAGVIHISPQFAIAAWARLDIDETRQMLRTKNGTPIIVGAGYTDGATPLGHAAPANDVEEWIYATGPIDIRRTDVFTVPDDLSQALDRGSNNIEYFVERHYLVSWANHVHAAVLADRCQTDC